MGVQIFGHVVTNHHKKILSYFFPAELVCLKKLIGNSFSFKLCEEYPNLVLSATEKKVLFFILRNKKTSEISQKLMIDLKKIKAYIHLLQSMLNVSNVSDMKNFAEFSGIDNIIPKIIFDEIYVGEAV